MIKSHSWEELEEDCKNLTRDEKDCVCEVNGDFIELSCGELHDDWDDGESGKTKDRYKNDE